MTAETAQAEWRSRRSGVAPLAPVAIAVMAGVVIDRYAELLGTASWAAVGLAAAVVASLVGRWGRLQATAILVMFLAVGGARHHRHWSDLPPDHLARSLTDDAPPRPAWLRGVLVETPEFRPPEFPDDEGSTRTVLDVDGLSDGTRWHPASGRVRLTIGGDRTDLAMGEPVEAAGTLAPIAGPRNPGETDYRAVLRGEQIRLRLSADGMSVWRDPDGRSRPWVRQLGQAREWSRKTLTDAIGPEAGPLAAALVLGRRAAVSPEVNDAFARTGTTHLLAISGLHLQVLALAVLVACRLVGLGPGWSAGLAALSAIGYAVLVGPMPSVVRSASMTVVVCAAVLRYRCPRPANVLAAAALVTIAWNPSDLFDVGCQLSFLAVASILWLVPIAVAVVRRSVPTLAIEPQAFVIELRPPSDPLDTLERKLAPRWKKGLWRARDWVALMLIASVVVWATTAPLLTLRFHLTSPIGILLNVPLIPMTSAALVLAAVTLALSAFWPPLGLPTATAAAALLESSEAIVRWGASLPWGHAFTPGPSAWWVAGYTGMVAVLIHVVTTRRSRRLCGLSASALGGWVIVGLGLALVGPRNRGPEVEVLAVDHGLAVLVQDGAGQTLLYDCGRMRDPKVGRRVIAPALWSKGISRIDAIVLSHADADHYNGLPDLLDRFAVGAIRTPPEFAGSDNTGTRAVLDAARSRGIPIRPVAAGEVWEDTDRASNRPTTPARQEHLAITVEHPPRDWLPGAPDNDRSLVLSLSFGGRRMLLTGDLDGAGLVELLARPTPPIDAMLAPHHGSRTANPPWLYAWARPGLVLVSQSSPTFPGRDALAPLESAFPVLRTWEQGAIRVRWEDDGIVATGFLGGCWNVRGGGEPAGGRRRAEAKTNVEAKADQSSRREESSANAPATSALALSASAVYPRPSAWPWLVALLGFVLGAVLVAAMAVIEWGAWALVRPGRQAADGEGSGQEPVEPPPWEPIVVAARDGVRLEGAMRPAIGENPHGRTALLVHGYAEDRSALRDRAEALARLGWDVALLDSRSRGRSAGDWSTFGDREADDLRTWLDALAPRSRPPGAAPRLFVAWGRSMGSAIVLRAAAADPRLKAVVLEAPYADLAHSVATGLRRSHLPGWLAAPILRRAGWLAGAGLDRPRPVDLAPRVGVPVAIIHGAGDPITPTFEVRRLAAAFPTPPTLIEIPGARHIDTFDVAGPSLAVRLAAWLDDATATAS